MLKKVFRALSQRINIIFLLTAGTLSWSLTMIKSGLTYPFGVGFWGANGHDGIWHIALARSLARGDMDMPIYSGEDIKNYHLGFDVFLGSLADLTKLPVSTLYFQVLPPVLAIMIGLAVYGFVKILKGKKEAFWSVFFLYFGGGFGWVVALLREGNIGGESMFWSQQSISTLINPPFALPLFLMFAGLVALAKLNYPNAVDIKFPKFFNNTYVTYFACILLFGVLVQV